MLVASDSHQTSSQLDPERREDIQGLRAIAVTAVVCFHAGLPLPGGFAGVDVFFVISGFVITLMLEREWQRRGSIGLPSFYFRRFKRLFPALSLLVSVSIAACALFLSPFGSEVEVSALTGIGAVLIAEVHVARVFANPGKISLVASVRHGQ